MFDALAIKTVGDLWYLVVELHSEFAKKGVKNWENNVIVMELELMYIK